MKNSEPQMVTTRDGKKIFIDVFRLEVVGSFVGAWEYLSVMERSIPEIEERELIALKEAARLESWEWEEYDRSSQELDGVLHYHVPRVLSYSYLTYLHSLVEVGLGAIADDLRVRRAVALRHNELRGSPIDRVVLFLEKVCGLAVRGQGDWQRLRDLAQIRDVLVHRGGRLGEDMAARERLRELAARLPVALETTNGWDDESSFLEVSYDLCRHFTREATSHIERLLELTRPTPDPS
jgi:hypothetical protein